MNDASKTHNFHQPLVKSLKNSVGVCEICHLTIGLPPPYNINNSHNSPYKSRDTRYKITILLCCANQEQTMNRGRTMPYTLRFLLSSFFFYLSRFSSPPP